MCAITGSISSVVCVFDLLGFQSEGFVSRETMSLLHKACSVNASKSPFESVVFKLESKSFATQRYARHNLGSLWVFMEDVLVRIGFEAVSQGFQSLEGVCKIVKHPVHDQVMRNA
jgi:hypothetical protein